jgi:putative FmdB family regulatory protein
MPTYEFYCEKCKRTFSVVLSISDYDKKKYNCPKYEVTILTDCSTTVDDVIL